MPIYAPGLAFRRIRRVGGAGCQIRSRRIAPPHDSAVLSLQTHAIVAFLRLPNKPRTDPEIMGRYSGTGDKADLDNHSNQLNPNNERYVGDEDGED